MTTEFSDAAAGLYRPPPRQINIHEAKTHLSRLVEEVAMGQEIIIAKAGKPIARLVPLEDGNAAARKPGRLKGKLTIGDDFDDPLPADIAKAFGAE